MNFKNAFNTSFWLFPIALILFYLFEQIMDVFYGDRSFHVYILGVFLAFFALVILAIIKSFKAKSDSHWFAVAVAFLLVFFWLDIRSHTALLVQALKIKLRPQIFSECVKNATRILDGGAIGLCEHKSYEIWHAVITEAIIYDSSDQIAKNHAQRSHAWNQTAYTLFHRKVRLYHMGYKATKLFGHYYYVYFSTELQSDFEPGTLQKSPPANI